MKKCLLNIITFLFKLGIGLKNTLTCNLHFSLMQVNVVSEPERIDVFLTRSCVQMTNISCGVMYEATLASLAQRAGDVI